MKNPTNSHHIVRFVQNMYKNGYINRYSIVIFSFFIWIFFFDKYKVADSLYLSSTIQNLENAKIEYTQMIKEAKKEKLILDLESEKFAREKYYMHKENEDVFIIEK